MTLLVTNVESAVIASPFWPTIAIYAFKELFLKLFYHSIFTFNYLVSFNVSDYFIHHICQRKYFTVHN